MKIRHLIVAAGVVSAFSGAALAGEPEVSLVIKDHRFIPEEVAVPAGQKVKLSIENQDSTPEEFESHELRREKVISGHSSATIWVGPLKPGTYPFVGEFHEATAKGRIVAK